MVEKHEFYQSYQRSGANFKSEVEVHQESLFFPDLYNDEIQCAISNFQGKVFTQCENVTVKGTTYKNGYAVVLSQGEHVFDLEFGIVRLILIDEMQSVYLIAEKYVPMFHPLLQLFF